MADDTVTFEAPGADDGFTMRASAEALDGTFGRRGHLRGWVHFMLLLGLAALFWWRWDDYVEDPRFLGMLILVPAVILFTAEGRTFLRRLVEHADLRLSVARDDHTPRFVRVRGRAVVRREVRAATYGAGVGAYFEMTPSPSERPWSDVTAAFSRRWGGQPPMFYTECGIGRLEVALEDGRRASIETDAFTLVDRRRFGFREALRTVVREGDLVEVRGIAHVRRTATNDVVFVFAGEHESMVRLAVLAR